LDEATRNLERALELDRATFTHRAVGLCLSGTASLSEAARAYERALTIVRRSGNRISLASVAVDWRADIKTFERVLDSLIAEDPSVRPTWMTRLRLCTRNPGATARA